MPVDSKLAPYSSMAVNSAQGSQANSDNLEKKCGLIKEGKASIEGGILSANNVFYNPAQVYNRDLSILVLRAFAIYREFEMKPKNLDVILRQKVEGVSKSKPAEPSNQRINLSSIPENVETSSAQAYPVAAIENSSPVPNETESESTSWDGKYPQEFPSTLLESSVDNKLSILEPLGASGLRSLRYALELEDVTSQVVCSDIDAVASQAIENNRKLNGVSESKMKVLCCEANQLMYTSKFFGMESLEAFKLYAGCNESSGTPDRSIKVANFFPSRERDSKASEALRFTVIDLDPYGSSVGFLDAAVQAVAEGGLLCLTCTDMPTLCGSNPEVSFYKYGGTALKARYMHEMSLRLLVHAVSVVAAKHKKIVEPLICCSVDFYIRCFLRVRTSPLECRVMSSKTALVLQCTACDSFKIIPLGARSVTKNPKRPDSKNPVLKFKPLLLPHTVLASCEQCKNENLLVGGPFYSGSLYNKKFLKLCLDLTKLPVAESLSMLPRIRGILTAMLQELADVPFFYFLPSLVNLAKIEPIKTIQFKSALLNLNYRVSHFHREPQSIKTDAPENVVFDILRTWAQLHPPKTVEGKAILEKTITTPNIAFDIHPESLKKSPDVSMWLPNPAPFWGPRSRVKRKPHPRHDEKKEENMDNNKRIRK